MIVEGLFLLGTTSVGYFIMKLISDMVKKRKARLLQIEKEKEDRHHQKKIEQIMICHRQEMQKMDAQIGFYDHQIQETKDQIYQIKSQQT